MIDFLALRNIASTSAYDNFKLTTIKKKKEKKQKQKQHLLI